MSNASASGDDLTVYLNPPLRCDYGLEPITTQFYDCKTTQGPWANLCPDCFGKIGVGLGTGLGQHYQCQPDGRFRKIEG